MIKRGAVPSDGFTIVPNAWLRDATISARAKGLLAYMLSHEAGYVLTMAQIQRQMTDGETSIRSGLEELEKAGYLKRERQRDDAGRLGTYEWTIGEIAGHDQAGSPSVDSPAQAVTSPKKTTEKKTKGEPSASPRGARLPEGWTPSPVTMSWYQVNILGGAPWSEASRAACRHEHEKFVDHWTSASGANARKVDWQAAWRNWMRRAFERKSPQASPVSAPPAPRTFRQMDADDRERDSLIIKAMEIVLDARPGTDVSEARQIVMDLLDQGKLDLNTLKTSAATGYSELNVITVEVKEVTGS